MTADEWAARHNRKKRRRWGCGYKATAASLTLTMLTVLLGRQAVARITNHHSW